MRKIVDEGRIAVQKMGNFSGSGFKRRPEEFGLQIYLIFLATFHVDHFMATTFRLSCFWWGASLAPMIKEFCGLSATAAIMHSCFI